MINLWDGWAITADAYQFILGRPVMRENKKADTEEQRIDNASYHTTLAKALAAFHKLQMLKYIRDNNQTLSQAVAASAQIEKRIRDAMPEPDFEREASDA